MSKELLKKFDKQFPLPLTQADENGGIDARPYIHAFITESIQQAVAEEREKIVKDIKKINKSNEDITSYGDGFEDSIGQVLTCITNRKVKIIIN